MTELDSTMIHTYLPSVSGPPVPLAGMAVYRILKQARDLVEQMEPSSEDQEAQIQATLDDLGLVMRSVIQEIDMSKSIKDPATQAAACDVPGASCDVPGAKLDIDYLTVSDTTSKVVLSSTDLQQHRRLLGQLRKCGGQATIFKALKF